MYAYSDGPLIAFGSGSHPMNQYHPESKENRMPRHFWLHLPPSPKQTRGRGIPVASVASTEDRCVEDGNDIVEISFVVVTYNPADIGLLPFSKAYGRNRSIGLLSSNTDNNRRHITVIDLPATTSGIDIKRAIIHDILYGEWDKRHPGAIAAKTAAAHWLNQHPQIKTPEESAAISALVTQHGADFSFRELSIPPASAAIATRYADDEPSPAPQEVEPMEFRTYPDPEDEVEIAGFCPSPDPPPTPDTPIEVIFTPEPEPPVEVTVRPGDEEALNRIFSGEHREENPNWRWSDGAEV